MFYNSYLTHIDLFYKNNYENIYKIPELKSIIVEIPLKQLTDDLYNLVSSNKNKILFESYFIFYIFFKFIPYISIKKKNYEYVLKIKYNKEDIMKNFIQLFVINYISNNLYKHLFNKRMGAYINTSTFKEFTNKGNYIKYNNKGLNKTYLRHSTNFRIDCPSLYFFNLSSYRDFFSINTNSKDIFLPFNIVINNLSKNDSIYLFFDVTNLWCLLPKR